MHDIIHWQIHGPSALDFTRDCDSLSICQGSCLRALAEELCLQILTAGKDQEELNRGMMNKRKIMTGGGGRWQPHWKETPFPFRDLGI